MTQAAKPGARDALRAVKPLAPRRPSQPAAQQRPPGPPPPPRTAKPQKQPLPPPGPELFAEAEKLWNDLDGLDYFQLFKIVPNIPVRGIKDAYYRESRKYHPDRFNTLLDSTIKERVNDIFKRVTEAYVVLRDDKKRAKYAGDVAGPDRAKKLRYTEASEVEQKMDAKKAVEEQIGTTPKGRESYRSGMKEFDAKRWEGALRHFKMALMYEPQNPKYKDKFKAAETELEKNRPKVDFRIK